MKKFSTLVSTLAVLTFTVHAMAARPAPVDIKRPDEASRPTAEPKDAPKTINLSGSSTGGALTTRTQGTLEGKAATAEPKTNILDAKRLNLADKFSQDAIAKTATALLPSNVAGLHARCKLPNVPADLIKIIADASDAHVVAPEDSCLSSIEDAGLEPYRNLAESYLAGLKVMAANGAATIEMAPVPVQNKAGEAVVRSLMKNLKISSELKAKIQAQKLANDCKLYSPTLAQGISNMATAN